MKVRMERFVLVPFSIGCNSHSSVAVAKTHRFPDDHKPTQKIVQPVTGIAVEKEESSSKQNYVKRKKVFKLVCLKKLCDKTKFISTIKTLSQAFVVYREEDEDDSETETEMEIGYPTDVKHVTHIGLDGTTTTRDDDVKGWESLKPPPEVISLPTISLRQFELAMAAQANHHQFHQPNIIN